MLQAFIIVLREGFEAFLIVAIIFAYLKKTNQRTLIPAVWWGILASLFASGALGWILLQGSNQALWEGVSALVAAVLVAWLVVHMWVTAPRLKQEMESKLRDATIQKAGTGALLGVFFFTAFMITREGMETALLLIQIHTPQIVTGIVLGALAAGAMASLWGKFGYLINLKRFFQVTSIFLLLCVAQTLFYAFHEFSEAGIFSNSEAFHKATEPFSSDGLYGKWFSLGMVAICAVWLVWAWLKDRTQKSGAQVAL